MGHHLTESGAFKSDKYTWCPEGFFALKLTDPIARLAARLYAVETPDKELAEDLRVACRLVETGSPPEPPPPPPPDIVLKGLCSRRRRREVALENRLRDIEWRISLLTFSASRRP